MKIIAIDFDGERRVTNAMKTIKVKLDKLTSKFFIYTHCDRKQYVASEILDENTVITCATCEIPIIMKDSNKDWYYVGDKVF